MLRISKAAERYSTAFFQVAKSEQLLDQVEKDLMQLDMLVSENDEIRHAISNPLISKKQLENFFKNLGEELKLQGLTLNFIRLLARKRRAEILPQIIVHFSKQLEVERDQLSVEVRSHTKMEPQHLQMIKEILHTKTSKEILLEPTVDKKLLGGIIIHYGSYKLDFSLRRKLSELKHELERLS